jgi:hypothetical protein
MSIRKNGVKIRAGDFPVSRFCQILPKSNRGSMTIPTHSPLYQKAFTQYLRSGTPIEISLKALAETAAHHTTPLYIWRTVGDGKVRASHAANANKVFAWDKPPATGNPGEDYGCRCWVEPYHGMHPKPYYDHGVEPEPGLDPVYPELLLIPFLRIPRLIAAWRLWVLQRNLSKTWKLGSHKSSKKWANRMEKGNWTPNKISEVIRKGEPNKAPNSVNKSNTATRYELGNDFVVIDDVTKEVLQVSEPGYIPKQF